MEIILKAVAAGTWALLTGYYLITPVVVVASLVHVTGLLFGYLS